MAGAAGSGGAAATVTLTELDENPYPVLARLRERAPICWVPAFGGWLVTGVDLAVAVLRDSRTFTVDDPRFTTARVVGPSMLSTDGRTHARHRTPFVGPLRRAATDDGLAGYVRAEATRLVTALRPDGAAELRRAVAGPLAAAVMAAALGPGRLAPTTVLGWYDAIVDAVTELSGPAGAATGNRTGTEPELATTTVDAENVDAGRTAFCALAARLREVIGADERCLPVEAARTGRLDTAEVVSNAAVVMFGGIETTEGMTTNAALHLLRAPEQLALVRAAPSLLPAAVEESLRLEPAAALVDRYATRDVDVGAAAVLAGDRVTVSLLAAGRDPGAFPDPDAFDVRRAGRRRGPGRQLAFGYGPHVCPGADLARVQAVTTLQVLLDMLPDLRLDVAGPLAGPRGLVFRKPPALPVRWDPL